jgi:hypothetical protein
MPHGRHNPRGNRDENREGRKRRGISGIRERVLSPIEDYEARLNIT